jgi:membrane-bound inhibitor of C-type lysozyme
MRPIPAAVLVVAASGLAACATTQPLARPASAPNLVYRCEAGKTFTAAYDAATERATVTAGGRVYILPQVISGSGIRYEQDGVELRSKGSWAMLAGAQGGPYDECQTD